MKRKLLFIVNVDWFFISHRLPIALAAQREGYAVHVAASITDKKEEMEKHGIIVHPLALARGKAGLGESWRNFRAMFALMRDLKPDLVHLVTIKPVLFGGIAARLVRVPSVVAAVSGLGFVFLAQGFKAFLRRHAVLFLYRLALGGSNVRVIFQNTADRDALLHGAGLSEEKSSIIRGSGVDLTKYNVAPLPDGVPVVVLPARLLADKGVREFVEAARLLKKAGRQVRFCLVGTVDPENPASLSEAEVLSWVAEGSVEVWGHRDDMPEVFGSAHIVVLPSYREGLPKALVEAAAAGRAVITTDVPGCRDAVESGSTGILVPAHDAQSLAEAIVRLLDNPRQVEMMGQAGRLLAEAAFDVRIVTAQHLDIYRELDTHSTFETVP